MDEETDFKVVVDTDGQQITAHVTGEIDMATCERLRDAIEPHLGPDQRIVVGLSGVPSWTRHVLACSWRPATSSPRAVDR